MSESDEPFETLNILRNTVIDYKKPIEPVDLDEWESLLDDSTRKQG